MFKALVTVVNLKQSSTISKSTPKTAVQTRNASVQDTLPTSRKEINEYEESLSDIIQHIVKEKLAAYENTIKALINSNLQAKNERLNKLVIEMGESTKSLEFTQSQLDEELGSVKEDINKLENNIKSIEKDFLDPDDVSTKLVEFEDRSQRNNLRLDGL